eukprot:TRINITY_DN5553_c0_g1_i1.p1 TRINITY_DN5553_c0_g1~~TRINITY_DN5553_c0_g1_i1.p1  ORF type:complete len:445 (-),score=67.60 TRINITY_DN5553_c0_g1_i1:101-1435(-)
MSIEVIQIQLQQKIDLLKKDFGKIKLLEKTLHFAKLFAKNFATVYGVVGSISLVLQILDMIRRKKFTMIDLVKNAKLSMSHVPASKWALCVACFFTSYEAINTFLNSIFKKNHINSMIAGAIAGLSIKFIPKGYENKRSIALYFLARAMQSCYNSIKMRGLWSFPGSNWKHYDSLFFCVATTPLLYSYVCAPESLPPSYLAFIRKLSPLSKDVLKAFTQRCEKQPVDFVTLNEYARKKSPFKGNSFVPPLQNACPPIIPCTLTHPESPSCLYQQVIIIKRMFSNMFPIYTSLTFANLLVSNFKSFIQKPVDTIVKGLLSSGRSTSFMVSCGVLFMGLGCISRKLFTHMKWMETKATVWTLCFFTSMSILLEKKNRRAEFGLYVLPRAIDSVYQLINKNNRYCNIKDGSVYIFCLVTAVLMYFKEYEPDNLAPFLKKMFNFFGKV